MTIRENRRRDRRERVPRKISNLPPGLEGGLYKPLSEAGVQRIHQAALSVLEGTGIEVVESECRQILEEAGARVDKARNRVFFPAGLVEASMKRANRNVVFYSKDGQADLHLTGRRVYLGTGGAAVLVGVWLATRPWARRRGRAGD